MSGHDVGIVLTALLASGVEFVEALTIVLAMGTTRGWRSAWAGVGAAVAVLAAITAIGGYALREAVPEHTLQLVIGALLLLFGLQWLRKAVLRAAGLKALHDEDATYREQVEAGRAAPVERRFGLDWVGFAVTFKGVLLEGVEVVIIVIGFGVSSGSVGLAVAGAVLGGVIVLAAGFALHRPLSRVL
jgi:Ca2+/H+ antiporter, TMEM165/GDT1 family